MGRKPKKERNIFERPPGSGNWYFRYWNEGRDIWMSARTKSEALELKAKYLEDKWRAKRGLDSPELTPQKTLTVAGLIERYRPEFEAKKSCRENQRYAMVWARDLGDKLAAKVVPGDIERWRLVQLAKGMKNNTVNCYTSFLRRMYSLAIRDVILEVNPLGSGRVKKLQIADPRDRVLTFAEEDKLLPELESVDRAAFVISLYSGLRQGEILGLCRSDINHERRTAKLRDTKAGKTQSARLSAAAMEAITWMLTQHDHELIFPNENGTGPMSGDRMTNRIKKAAEGLGLKNVLFHTARHCFITRLSEAGHDIGVVKNAARHSTITMTDAYMHTGKEASQAAVDGLCSRFIDRGGLFPAAPSAKGHLRALP